MSDVVTTDQIPENWTYLRKLVSVYSPSEAANLFDFIWNLMFEDSILTFERERKNEIQARTDYAAKNDPEKSTTAPGMSWEMRLVYEPYTAGLTNKFRTEAKLAVARVLDDALSVSAEAGGYTESALLNRMNVEFQAVYAEYKGLLDYRLSRVTRLQESYIRPFVKPYAIMVVVYEVLGAMWKVAIIATAARIISRVMDGVIGTPAFAPARATAVTIQSVANMIARPAATIRALLQYIVFAAPKYALRYAKELRITENISSWWIGPVGIAPALSVVGGLVALATASFIVGYVVGYVGWEVLRALGVNLPSANKGDEDQLRASVSPEDYGLVREKASELASEISNVILAMDAYRKELSGEEQPVGPVRPLVERLEGFRSRVVSVADKVAREIGVSNVSDPLVAAMDALITEAKVKAGPSVLGAATIVSGNNLTLDVDPQIVWDIVVPEIMTRLGDMLDDIGGEDAITEDLVESVAQEVLEEKRSEWEAAIETDAYLRLYKIYGPVDEASSARAVTAAQAIQDMLYDPTHSSYDFRVQASVLESTLPNITDADTKNAIEGILSAVNDLIADLTEVESRERAVRGGGNEMFDVGQGSVAGK